MGGNCCLAAKDSGATAPHIPPITANKHVYETGIEAHNDDGSRLDLIYAQHRHELRDLSSRMNIPKPPSINSKRSSQPSLLRLNNEITRMIHTFEKAHGTIGNQLTRTNLTDNSHKNKEANNDVAEIGFIKKKRVSDTIVVGNQEIPTTQQPIVTNGLMLLNNKEEQPVKVEDKKITEQSHNDFIQDSYESSTLHNNDEYCDPAEASKNLLDAELVDEDVERCKQQLYQKNSVVEGNFLPLWDIFDTESFSLNVAQLNFRPENAVFFSAIGSITFYYQMFKITLPAYSKDQNGGLMVKLWINGAKRYLKVDNTSITLNPIEVFDEAIRKLYGQNPISKSPCQQVYHLSGWCPECLLMEEISNKDNLWDRLAENFLDGNIIISFGIRLKQGQQIYLTLKNVKREEGILEILSPKGPPLPDMPANTSNIYEVEWRQLSPTVERIYINWNPSIYSYNKKFGSCWTVFPDTGPFQDQQICIANNPQFLIKIPKHDEDFEIRIFVDRHIKQFRQNQHVILKLFEYDGMRALDPRGSIRNLDSSDRQLMSDVFIFEKSDEVDHFILTVMSGNQEKVTEEICLSILFLSFIQIEVTQLPLRQNILTKSLSSAICEDNVGMGINSPNFTNNLHYSLQVPHQSDIQILVEGHAQMDFSIFLFEDPNKTEDLLKIDFETILNDNIPTEIFQGYGFLEKEAKLESYILVIACYSTSSSSQRIKVTTNVVSKLFRRNREIEECYPPIKMDQIFCRPNIIKTFPIKWSKENTGQRKRLKNTTTPIYHPISTFAEFLKNPCTQIKLARGRYQFNVFSEDYKSQFLSGNPYQKEEKLLEPPALSMAILRLSDNEKGYKIILDDAFYVPLGYGFWTGQLTLEQGKYTIVCPRINRQIGKGTMKIRQL